MNLYLGVVPFLFTLVTIIIIGLKKFKIIFMILLVAFFLRAGLAFTHAFIIPLPGSQADAVMFEHLGWEWANDSDRSIFSNFTTGAFIYSWIISILYMFTDRSPLMIQGINVFLGTISVYLVWLITMKITNRNKKISSFAALIVALWPTLNLYSALTMREEWICFFAILGIYYSVLWWEKNKIIYFLISISSFLGSLSFHSGMVIFLAIYCCLILFRWFSSFLQNKGNSFVRQSLLLMVMIGIIVFVSFTSFGLEKLGKIMNDGLEGLSDQQAIAARSRAAYLSNLTIQSPVDFLWMTPIRVLYFLFAPFPWMITNLEDVIGFLDSVMIMWLFYRIYKNKESIFKNKSALIIFLFLIGCIIMFAIGTSNYGTAIRHRAKLVPLMAILASLRKEKIERKECSRHHAIQTHPPHHRPQHRRSGDDVVPVVVQNRS
ncbi:hypothetical protein IMZ17_17085 [Geobacillus stearothermophilus]|nr:hypothetical protein IMZ17_17085 [Geobacillus stearothermophilus]